MMPLLGATIVVLLAGAGGGGAWSSPPVTFAAGTEYPASAQSPATTQYVSFVPRSALPPGTRWLRLVVTAAGPGRATALPVEWAHVADSANARLLISPVNYSAGLDDQAVRGVLTARVEAWSDPSGAVLGVSGPIEVHFDYSVCGAKFDRFEVTATGPGQAFVELTPAGESRAAIKAGMSRGLYFFARYTFTGTRTPAGVPIFDPNGMQEQFQYAAPNFHVAWTQPGLYYVALYGAYTGTAVYNVVWSPLDGVRTPPYPSLGGGVGFQPLALVVPFSNGTVPALPAGFKGPVHVLAPIPGDRRIALIKQNMTWYQGGHFHLPLTMPYTPQAPPDPAHAVLAVDVDLPLGVTMPGTTPTPASAGAGGIAPPTTSGDPHRHRVRAVVPPGAVSLPLGVLIDASAPGLVMGQRRRVGFRAVVAGGTKPEDAPATVWTTVSVLLAARPNFALPRRMTTSVTFAADVAAWPADTGLGVTPLDTYRRLGLNTVPADPAWSDAGRRAADPKAWKGLFYGPAGSAFATVQAQLGWTAKAVLAANITALCNPGTFASGDAETAAWLAAARYFAEHGGQDLGYRGCLRRTDLQRHAATMATTRPDTAFLDVRTSRAGRTGPPGRPALPARPTRRRSADRGRATRTWPTGSQRPGSTTSPPQRRRRRPPQRLRCGRAGQWTTRAAAAGRGSGRSRGGASNGTVPRRSRNTTRPPRISG